MVYVGHSFALCWCQLHVHRNTDHATEDAVPACELTLRNLQLDYLDLYLVRDTLHYRGKGMRVCWHAFVCYCVRLHVCLRVCVCSRDCACLNVFVSVCMHLCVCMCVHMYVASGLQVGYHPAYKCQPPGRRS